MEALVLYLQRRIRRRGLAHLSHRRLSEINQSVTGYVFAAGHSLTAGLATAPPATGSGHPG